jgi:hypothetical protein
VSLGYTPGVFAKSVEVVWNEEIAKRGENKSVEVTDGMGVAGGATARRVRKEVTFTDHGSTRIILCQYDNLVVVRSNDTGAAIRTGV